MERLSARRASYKSPPISDIRLSQQARREHALEEQRQRRQRSIEASRQLDAFADLDLGPSDDDIDESNKGDDPEIIREGVGQFASMLSPATGAGSSAPITMTGLLMPTDPSASGSSKKRKGKKKKSKRKQSKWANKCMYAELLEMQDDHSHLPLFQQLPHDGLPDDLESGWVALAPVPVGKRCLAVSQTSAGVSGTVPRTILRSRVLGKILISPFPSLLPPSTILDCILDQNWRENGILHVLDVMRWKGQNVADCEAAFRFWWRDTRLSELPPCPPPPSSKAPNPDSQEFDTGQSTSQPYCFPHPINLIPIPYISPTPYAAFGSTIIPRARSAYTIPIQIRQGKAHQFHLEADEMEMDADVAPSLLTMDVPIQPDGLLLYVAHASYEPGTSPLSTWVPIRNYEERSELTQGEDQMNKGEVPAASVEDGPLALFERLVLRRLTLQNGNVSTLPGILEIGMDST